MRSLLTRVRWHEAELLTTRRGLNGNFGSQMPAVDVLAQGTTSCLIDPFLSRSTVAEGVGHQCNDSSYSTWDGFLRVLVMLQFGSSPRIARVIQVTGAERSYVTFADHRPYLQVQVNRYRIFLRKKFKQWPGKEVFGLIFLVLLYTYRCRH